MMELLSATKRAIDIWTELRPTCSKIKIAGSIRRSKPVIRDIEIVCLPNTNVVTQTNMFGDSIEYNMRNVQFVALVNGLGRIVKGKPIDGRYVQVELPDAIYLDIFIPVPEDYYRMLAIRTGSVEYVKHSVAAAWVRQGWVGTDKGLRRKEECVSATTTTNKHIYKVIDENTAQKPPVWESEKEFFDFIKIPYIDPKFRTI